MLKYRLITGPLLIAALIGLVIFDDWLDTVVLSDFWSDVFRGKQHPPRGLALFTLGLAVTPLAARELCTIFRANGIHASTGLTALAAALGLIVSYGVPMDTPGRPGAGSVLAIAIVSTALVLMFVAALLYFSRRQNIEGVVAAAGGVMFAMVYLGLMFGFLLLLRRGHSAWIIVGVIFITKSCDTGAYFTGRAIGRHKLIPWLSPGKTWEGLAGGVVLASLVGLGLAALSRAFLQPSDQVPAWLGLTCGVAFALVGQFGDLTVSLFKRGAGIKDSSRILPGLGGVLDVLDSPLMVAPVAFWLLESCM